MDERAEFYLALTAGDLQQALDRLARRWSERRPTIDVILYQWRIAPNTPMTPDEVAFLDGIIELLSANTHPIPWDTLKWVLERGDERQCEAVTRLLIECNESILDGDNWPRLTAKDLPLLTRLVEAGLYITGSFFVLPEHARDMAAFYTLAVERERLSVVSALSANGAAMRPVLRHMSDAALEKLLVLHPAHKFGRQAQRVTDRDNRQAYNSDIVTDAVWQRRQCYQLAKIAPALVQLDISVYPLFWVVRWIWPELPEYHAIRILVQTREVHRKSLGKRLKCNTES